MKTRAAKSWLLIGILAAFQATSLPARAKEAPKSGALRIFDPDRMDRSVDPCADFYHYACGTWIKNTPLPRDRGVLAPHLEAHEHNVFLLRQILEAAAVPDPRRNLAGQKSGDYYAACMDEGRIEAQGILPLKAALDRIARIDSRKALAETIAMLESTGDVAIIRLVNEQDYKDPASMIACVDQGQLGLPGPDDYIKRGVEGERIRALYVEYVTRIFALLGDSPEGASAGAAAVMEIEGALAKSTLGPVARQDPDNLYHKMSRADLIALAPSFAWNEYFEAMGAPPFETVNVRVPGFVKKLEHVLETASLDSWKAYLRFQLVSGWASYLSSPFVNASFDFYEKTLSGAQEPAPRWKRCVEFTLWSLGDALGQLYVKVAFSAESKEEIRGMVVALKGALARDITELPWMGRATKEEALDKLHALRYAVGYPDRWRDDSALSIARDDFVGNERRAWQLNYRRALLQIGQPVDRDVWNVSPAMVNGNYHAGVNRITLPAGSLQPPFYDEGSSVVEKYGAIGVVIGHELTHGFDGQGRKFDGAGARRDWWSARDAREFKKRSRCFVKEYSEFTPLDGVAVNGRLTLDENIADNGGVRIAYLALKDRLDEEPVAPAGDFTPEQRFFLAYAQSWCANVSDDWARYLTRNDEHSLPPYRVNGVVTNMPEFRNAFACKEGDPMVRDEACRIW